MIDRVPLPQPLLHIQAEPDTMPWTYKAADVLITGYTAHESIPLSMAL